MSKFRRCLATSNGTGADITFLNDSDSNQYEDGTTANLTGSEGDVMVYFPEFWYLGEDTVDGWRLYLTEDSEVGSRAGMIHVPASLVGAYKSFVIGGSLHSYSGINTDTTRYTYSFDQSSSYARNRAGFHLIDWQQHRIIGWMFMLKYKTRNSQYILGGTGTEGENATTGLTNSQGMTDVSANYLTNYTMSFLGIENCWGYRYEWMEGIHFHSGEGVIAYDKGIYVGYDYNSIPYEGKRIVHEDVGWTSGGIMKEIYGGRYLDTYIKSSYGGTSGESITNRYQKYWCDTCGYVGAGDDTYLVSMRSGGNRGGGGNSEYVEYWYYQGVFFTNISMSSSHVPTGEYPYEDYGTRLAFDGTINILSNEEYKKKMVTSTIYSNQGTPDVYVDGDKFN